MVWCIRFNQQDLIGCSSQKISKDAIALDSVYRLISYSTADNSESEYKVAGYQEAAIYIYREKQTNKFAVFIKFWWIQFVTLLTSSMSNLSKSARTCTALSV